MDGLPNPTERVVSLNPSFQITPAGPCVVPTRHRHCYQDLVFYLPDSANSKKYPGISRISAWEPLKLLRWCADEAKEGLPHHVTRQSICCSRDGSSQAFVGSLPDWKDGDETEICRITWRLERQMQNLMHLGHGISRSLDFGNFGSVLFLNCTVATPRTISVYSKHQALHFDCVLTNATPGLHAIAHLQNMTSKQDGLRSFVPIASCFSVFLSGVHPQLGLLPTAFPLAAAKVDEEVRTPRSLPAREPRFNNQNDSGEMFKSP